MRDPRDSVASGFRTAPPEAVPRLRHGCAAAATAVQRLRQGRAAAVPHLRDPVTTGYPTPAGTQGMAKLRI